jgi:tRNA(Ile)-lysidine synthetase-like protein
MIVRVLSAWLIPAVRSLPVGSYAVAVSGGADSVALLHLLVHHRPDVALHVVHLDHQTRGEASTGDAAFAAELCERWKLPNTMLRRDQIEPLVADLPANKSARFRAIRIQLFKQVVAERKLAGVLLAHHADDQAETVLQRLLRGSHAPHLTGMRPESRQGELRMLRPLLAVPRQLLREYLVSVNQPWREDASNDSMDYFRNRLRRLLASHPPLTPALLQLHEALALVCDWAKSAAPRLPTQFAVTELAGLPALLARESARRWLSEQGAPAEALAPAVLDQLLTMAADAASAPRQHFPGRLCVRRRKGRICSEAKLARP